MSRRWVLTRTGRRRRCAGVIGTSCAAPAVPVTGHQRQEDRLDLRTAALERARLDRNLSAISDDHVVLGIHTDDQPTRKCGLNEWPFDLADRLGVGRMFTVYADVLHEDEPRERHDHVLAAVAQVQDFGVIADFRDRLLRPGVHEGHPRTVRSPNERSPDRGDSLGLEHVDDRLGADRARQNAEGQGDCRHGGGDSK